MLKLRPVNNSCIRCILSEEELNQPSIVEIIQYHVHGQQRFCSITGIYTVQWSLKYYRYQANPCAAAKVL